MSESQSDKSKRERSVSPSAEDSISSEQTSSLLSHVLMETVENKGKSKNAPDRGSKYLIAGSLIVLAALVIVFAGIRAAQSIVGPFLLAGFLAVILTAPLRWLKSKGFSDMGAYLIICIAVLICGISIIWILSGSVNQFIVRLPEYTRKFNKTLSNIDDVLEPYGLSLHGGPPKDAKSRTGGNGSNYRHDTPDSMFLSREQRFDSDEFPQEKPGIHDGSAREEVEYAKNDARREESQEPETSPKIPVNPTNLLDEMENALELSHEASTEKEPPADSDSSRDEKKLDDEGENGEGEEKEFISPHFFEDLSSAQEEKNPANTFGIVGLVRDGIAELTKLATICFIVMILVVFMMYEASRLPKKIIAAFGPQGITNDHLQNIVEKIWKYMFIKSIISFFVGFFVWVLLICTGVDYPMLWALIAFFLNFIPNIGSIIAAIPPVALALFDGGGGTFLVVGIGYLVINQGLGYYVEPIFLGDGLGISPLVVLLSLIFWGWLLGLIGMFLSAPLTIILKIVFDSFEETRWISLLMDNKLRSERET